MATAVGGAVASYFGYAAGTFGYVAVQTTVAVAFTVAAGYATNALVGGGEQGYSKEDGLVTVKQPAVPWEYVYGTVRKGGSYAFIHSTDNNKYLHLVIILADREVENISEIHFDDQVVALDEFGDATGTDKNGDNFKNYVRVIKKMGSDDQTAFSELIADAPDKWTSAHRLRGKACIYVRLKYDAKRFPRGVPNITAVVDGHKIYDPRDAGQSPDDRGSWKFDTNATNVVADYIRDPDISLNASADDFPLAEWVAAANACDESVPKSGGGSEKRYACAGVLSSSPAIKSNLESLLTSMNGEIVTNGSLWKIYPAVWRAPTKSLNDDDFRAGGATTKARRPRKELYNGVRGTFKSPDNDYQLADYPAVTSDAFIAKDGKENFLDIELPFTQSAATAQRIAKILLMENRQEISTSWRVKMTAWSIEAADNVELNRDTLGWVNKYFRVKRAPTVNDNGKMGMKLEMVETDPSIYDWSTDEEKTTDPAPNTNLPNPMFIAEPASVTLESGSDLLQIDSTGQVHSLLRVTISPPVDAFVKEYKLEWRVSDALVWNEMVLPAHTDTATKFDLAPVIDLKTYHVRVLAIGHWGAESDYAEAIPHLVLGKGTAPGDVDVFSITIQPDGTREFNAVHYNPEADVVVGGGYQIFYEYGNTIDLATAKALTTGKFTSWPYETNLLGAGEYTFACVVLDSSKNPSENPKIITATLPARRALGSVKDWNEKVDGWTGTRTDGFVNYENEIESVGAQTWDELPDTWDELEDTWAEIVTSVSSTTYVTTVKSLGTDITITPLVSIDAVGTATIKMRTAKTADGADLSALPFVDVSQVQCDYIQFEIVVTTTPGNPAAIKNLSVVLDGDLDTDDQANIDTALASSGTFERIDIGHFKIGVSKAIAEIFVASITAKFVAEGGWSDALISTNTTLLDGTPAAEFKMYDSTNALADAAINVQLKGPKS